MKKIILILFFGLVFCCDVDGEYHLVDKNSFDENTKYERMIEIGEKLFIYSKKGAITNQQKIKVDCVDDSLLTIKKLSKNNKKEKIGNFLEKMKNSSSTLLYHKYGYYIFQSNSIHQIAKGDVEGGMHDVPFDSKRKVLIKIFDKKKAKKKFEKNINLIDKWLSSVSEENIFEYLVSLTFYNRYTLSNGIYAARDYIVDQIKLINDSIDVTTQKFFVNGKEAYNIIATLKGTSNLDDWYIIGGF